MSSPQDLGVGSINENTGKPIFVAASQSLYTANERGDLSNADRIHYRNTKLQKSIEAIARRDAVYHDLAQENYTGGSITYQVLGTPYPVIEPFPSVYECYGATRWYEMAAAVGVSFGWGYWVRSSVSYRHMRNPRIIRYMIPSMMSLTIWSIFALEGQNRLMGFAENEHEADKFGVYDTPENLERKAKNWAKFAAYKEEWMRRYNYSNFGERPHETGNFMSALWLPYSPVRYNTRTNYPARKNPMWLTTTPLRDFNSEWAFTYSLPTKNSGDEERRSDDPVQAGRPELSERYLGPIRREEYFATK